MLLKNSPWAAGVHSLSAVRPWGQGGRGGGREVEGGGGERRRDGCERENRSERNVENRMKYGWK